MTNIAVLVGSASKTSFNQKIAEYVQSHAPENLRFTFLTLHDLPVYDRDLDEQTQAQSYQRFRAQVAEADAFIWVTPEHNAGVPALLKNAIDVATRPAGENLWQNKPVGIITAAAAMSGGQRAGDQLRITATSIGMKVLSLQTAIAQVHTVFDEQGKVNDASVRRALDKFITEYTVFLDKILC